MAEPKRIWVWLRVDGEPPCVLQVGARPRGPGEVYEVRGALSRAEAEQAVVLALQPEPNEDLDGSRFLAWRKARRQTARVVYARNEAGDGYAEGGGYELLALEGVKRGH